MVKFGGIEYSFTRSKIGHEGLSRDMVQSGLEVGDEDFSLVMSMD